MSQTLATLLLAAYSPHGHARVEQPASLPSSLKNSHDAIKIEKSSPKQTKKLCLPWQAMPVDTLKKETLAEKGTAGGTKGLKLTRIPLGRHTSVLRPRVRQLSTPHILISALGA